MPFPLDAVEPEARGRLPLSRIFLLIILTEVASILGLYWFGRHFS
jgi:hypothetical protein